MKILSVATAGVLIEQLWDANHKAFPRVDYIELQHLLNADTMDYSCYDQNVVGKVFRSLETQWRSDLYLAALSWLRSSKYDRVFAWSERAGIPLAAYKRLAGSNNQLVAMFQCWSPRQELVITTLQLLRAMDSIVVHCSSMKQKLVSLGAPVENVKVIHYSIDQDYFSPLPGAQQQRMIMSIGEPRSRDYASLFKAVDGLSIQLSVPAYGHWYAREKHNGLNTYIPENVYVMKHLSQPELRDLYARAQFVVLPIRDLVYSAGATATLEAGCMARAVIAFRSAGISDYIIDGETGILIEPGDVAGLRDAIEFLLSNPDEAKRLGQNGRQRIMSEFTLEKYVQRIAELLTAILH
jgi:glycosyltransferase involved in cell wall biosynthesis